MRAINRHRFHWLKISLYGALFILLLMQASAHAQSTGDAVKDAQIQKLWTSCKTAPQTDFVHICLRDMTDAAHLWTQAEATKAAKAKAVKK